MKTVLLCVRHENLAGMLKRHGYIPMKTNNSFECARCIKLKQINDPNRL